MPRFMGSGLTAPEPIGNFLNGNMPALTPGDGQNDNPLAPVLLSQTGAFSDLTTLTPSAGVLPYDMIEPFWSDGAEKKRWMSIPNDGTHNTAAEQIQFSAEENWVFPIGATLIKHFELGGKRLETRFEIRGSDGVYYYLTYKWNDAQTDAELLESSFDEEILVNGQFQTWHYPSRSECLSCHLTEVGSVLGPKTRHLNSNMTYPTTGLNANQLVTLSSLGILNETITDANSSNYMAVAAKDDLNASLEFRARSYIDVNCSNCHQPATPNGAQFDARITTPLQEQNLINGAVIYDLGLGDPRVIIPQDVDHSMIHHRMNSLQTGTTMPPLAKNVIDADGVQLIADWINSLAPESTQNLVTTGDASQVDGGCYEITPSALSQSGAAWYPTSVDFSQNVSINFSANWGAIDAGTDGMALVFQNQGTTVEANAPGPGLGAVGISPSLTIEFDSYNNGGNDITEDHIAIWQNGDSNNLLVSPTCMDADCANIEDGQIHIVKVDWDAALKVLTVIFDDNERATYSGNFINTIFGGNNSLFVGVTGSTGGAATQQTLCSFYINSAAENETPIAAINATPISGTAPLNVNFDGSNSSDGDGDDLTYNWNFGDSEIASGTQTSHTYTTPGTYNATLTVSDGQVSNQTNITITVNEPTMGNAVSFSDQTGLLTTSNYSGVAFAIVDMNGDKKDDIVRFNQGKELNVQYQNGSGQFFTNYMFGSISGSRQWSICVADTDQDGFNDILSGGAYDNLKLTMNNNGNNSYTTTTLPNSNIFIQGSNFADIDNDGWVDIFACHDDAESRPFRNNQDGTYVYDWTLIDTKTTPTSDNSGNYASIWTDYDNDGDLDLYISKCRIGVSSSADPRRINMLFNNDGNNNFTEVAATAGLKIGEQSWLTDFADIDNDGDLDCIVANHYADDNLMRNNGDGTFTDITAGSGLLPTLAGSNAFGIQAFFRDLNNDGFVDIIYTGTKHFIFYNNGNGTFTESGNPFNANQIESLAIGDLNHDGFLDIYAGYANIFNTPSSKQDRLFLNNGNSNHYLNIQLEGVQSNINGIGARVEIYGSWGKQIREVRSGEGYGVMNSFTQHFGLGGMTQIDEVVVRWPSGIIQSVINPAPDQFLTIIEAEGCNLAGTSCNDNDACTNNDLYDIDCNCVGTFQDSDGDGICDANDNTNGDCTLGESCNDGDVCTINDSFDANCNCVGTFQDADDDGICDANDATNGDCTLAAPCTDNDTCTENDNYDANCNCVGTLIDTNNNGVCDTEEMDCTGTQYPYECNFITIPATIEAEEYDEGGEGIAYHDDALRNGDLTYRPNDNVDAVSGVIGWTKNGEWLEYTINVTAGTYTINLDVASSSANPGDLNILLNGNLLTEFDIVNTGGWGTYNTLSASGIFLNGGDNQVLRLNIIGGNFNIDKIEFVLDQAGCTVGGTCTDGNECTVNDMYDANCNCVGTLLDEDNNGICDLDELCNTAQYPYECQLVSIPGKVEIEEYDEGGEGIAYHDDDTRNGDTSYRPNDDVDAISGIVGWIKNGEWLEYTVNVEQTGLYTIRFAAASNNVSPGEVNVSLAGSPLANFDVQNTTSWGNYSILSAMDIFLPAGTAQILRLDFIGGNFNADYIDFELTQAGCTVIGQACDDGDICTENDTFDTNCNCTGTIIDANNNGTCDLDELCSLTQYPYQCNLITIPATVEVEEYDEGGEGIAYHDDATRDGDMSYRTLDKVDATGGIVGWIKNGEWLEYTINVTGGTYTIQLDAASGSTNPGSVNLSIAGTNLGSFDIQNTGGWGTYTTLSIPNVFIAGGETQVLRLDFVGSSFNLDNIEFILEDVSCTVGAACDDGDNCTINDVYDANCNCVGTFQDADNDGICDADDACPTDPTNTCTETTYCTLVGNNNNYEWLQQVVYGTINNDSGNNGGYADFTSMSTTVARGQITTINLTPGYLNNAYNEAFVVWIDFNQDGDFSDADEQVFTGMTTTTLTGNITIPANALIGTTRMRIGMQWNTFATGSCGAITYGEVEDYSVNITATQAAFTFRQTENMVEDLPAFTLFPNPTRNSITIELDQAITESSLELYNNAGILVQQMDIAAEQQQFTLDVRHFAAGMYMVRIQMPDGRAVSQRFIKIE